MTRCVRCGAPVGPGAFCGSCGARVATPAGSGTPAGSAGGPWPGATGAAPPRRLRRTRPAVSWGRSGPDRAPPPVGCPQCRHRGTRSAARAPRGPAARGRPSCPARRTGSPSRPGPARGHARRDAAHRPRRRGQRARHRGRRLDPPRRAPRPAADAGVGRAARYRRGARRPGPAGPRGGRVPGAPRPCRRRRRDPASRVPASRAPWRRGRRARPGRRRRLLSGAAAWASTPSPAPITVADGRTTTPTPDTTTTAPPVGPLFPTQEPTPTSTPFADGVDGVGLGPAAAGAPDASAVQAVLARYFAAINAHDYDAWAATVLPSLAQPPPRRTGCAGTAAPSTTSRPRAPARSPPSATAASRTRPTPPAASRTRASPGRRSSPSPASPRADSSAPPPAERPAGRRLTAPGDGLRGRQPGGGRGEHDLDSDAQGVGAVRTGRTCVGRRPGGIGVRQPASRVTMRALNAVLVGPRREQPPTGWSRRPTGARPHRGALRVGARTRASGAATRGTDLLFRSVRGWSSFP